MSLITLFQILNRFLDVISRLQKQNSGTKTYTFAQRKNILKTWQKPEKKTETLLKSKRKSSQWKIQT